MKEKGLRVKLALDDQGIVGGMIQYAPIENSTVEGQGLYFVYCIWVHGRKEGRGDFRKRGMGKALLQNAEENVRQLGAKGLVAWGISLPKIAFISFGSRNDGMRQAESCQQLALEPSNPRPLARRG